MNLSRLKFLLALPNAPRAERCGQLSREEAVVGSIRLKANSGNSIRQSAAIRTKNTVGRPEKALRRIYAWKPARQRSIADEQCEGK